MAMKKELSFIADTFRIPTLAQHEVDDSSPLLKDLDTWSLQNIWPEHVLNIPNRLRDEYHISPSFLETAMKPYLIQTIGKESLEREFGIGPMIYLISQAKHYSWPKGAGER